MWNLPDLAQLRKRLAFTLNGGGYSVTAHGSTEVAVGQWTHIAVEFDHPSRDVRFFIDGAADPVTYLSSDITSGAGTVLRIGSDTSSSAGSYFFDGRMDNVGIAVIPEPVTTLGVFLGVSSLAGYVRRRRLA